MKAGIENNSTPLPFVYVALLRGINVGGHKKVPMAELKKTFKQLGFGNIRTLLASGNVVFESGIRNKAELHKIIINALEQRFGFSIPVILSTFSAVKKIVDKDPFKNIPVTPETRLYVTFLGNAPDNTFKIPYTSPDGSFKILAIADSTIFSFLDLAKTKTGDVMKVLDKEFGKNNTTRNWNTVVKIAAL